MPCIISLYISYRLLTFSPSSSIRIERVDVLTIFTMRISLKSYGDMAENTVFSYEADPRLVVFLFSSSSTYSGLNCTILLSKVVFSHTLLNKFYIYSGKGVREKGRRTKVHAKAFSPHLHSLKCFDTYFDTCYTVSMYC